MSIILKGPCVGLASLPKYGFPMSQWMRSNFVIEAEFMWNALSLTKSKQHMSLGNSKLAFATSN
jgi:hypothetical protein